LLPFVFFYDEAIQRPVQTLNVQMVRCLLWVTMLVQIFRILLTPLTYVLQAISTTKPVVNVAVLLRSLPVLKTQQSLKRFWII